jgi:hypothetical protein
VTEPKATTERPELRISSDKVCYITIKAREYDAKEDPSVSDPGSNPSDDKMYDVLEDHPDDPVREELAAAITALTEDEQVDLVALVWLGRGDGDITEWEQLRLQALEARATGRTWRYLLGIPLLADYLQEGLAAFDLTCEDLERVHL